MIDGVHFLLYSRDADADRRFVADVLGFHSVDVGHGWLIFALPPSELAVHPSTANFVQRHADHEVIGAVVYLMCRDLGATIEALQKKGVATTEIEEENWGLRTTIKLPGGSELGLYQPTHPTAITMGG
jgi:catechol 2,3-dioxygenase-like lactoylglutathione lyase family enzyme